MLSARFSFLLVMVGLGFSLVDPLWAAPSQIALIGEVADAQTGERPVRLGAVTVRQGSISRTWYVVGGRFVLRLPTSQASGASYDVTIRIPGYARFEQTITLPRAPLIQRRSFSVTSEAQEHLDGIVRALQAEQWGQAYRRARMALSLYPRDARMRFLAGVTEVAVLGDDAELKRWAQEAEDHAPPEDRLPLAVQSRIARAALPALSASASRLAAITTPFQFTISVPHPWSSSQAVDIDDSDAAMLRAAVQFARALCLFTQAYTVDVRLSDLESAKHGEVPLSTWITQHPNLFRIRDSRALLQCRQALLAAIDHYLDASRRMRGETDPQEDDLFSISHVLEDQKREQQFVDHLKELRLSLNSTPDEEFGLRLNQFLDLGRLFTAPIEPRAFLTGRGIQQLVTAHLAYQIGYLMMALQQADPTQTYARSLEPYSIQDTVRFAPHHQAAALSALSGLGASLQLLSAYDVDVDGAALIRMGERDRRLDVTTVLARHPRLLGLQEPDALVKAREGFRDAAQHVLDLGDLLSQDTDIDPLDRRVQHVPDDLWEHHQQALDVMDDLFTSLEVRLPSGRDETLRVDFNPLFSQDWKPRELLPSWQDNHPVPGSIPDPTFGGVFPELTREDWE